jgi:ribonucleoside-diphosphate reductase alpha chain
LDGLALSILIGLQYGVPLKALVDKLTNTRFEPSGFRENPTIRYTSSVLDYIARWQGGRFLSSEYLKPRAASSDEDMIHAAISSPAVNARNHKPIQSGNSRRHDRRCPFVLNLRNAHGAERVLLQVRQLWEQKRLLLGIGI